MTKSCRGSGWAWGGSWRGRGRWARGAYPTWGIVGSSSEAGAPKVHPTLARSALDRGLFAVVREVADGTGVGGGARVRTLARQEQKELPHGDGEEVEKEDREREEKGADFTGAVLSSQQKRAPHEKGKVGAGERQRSICWKSGSVWSRRRRAPSSAVEGVGERLLKLGVAPPL